MKKIVGLCLLLFMTLFVMAEEDFDSFDDEDMSFVIKTKKPKIVVKKDSQEDDTAIKFVQESTGKNSAITMHVENFLVFSKLKDVDAKYIVLSLSFKNILPSQKVIVSNGSNHPASWLTKSSDDYEYKEAVPLYQIPDIMQHLYLSVNNKVEQPIDIMSVLLDKPLIDYSTNTVEVMPEKQKKGEIAFRIPKSEKIKQLSLHYYDTKYGNIDIPMVGEMKTKSIDVTHLPTKAWKKMNENFSLSVSGYKVEDNIGKNKAKQDGQFEIVEIDIQSKVYALLKFNPAERFYLKLGDSYALKLHPITDALPMGLYGDASLTPGANNKFRLAFYVPKGMDTLSRSLMVELKGEDIVLPIKKGENSLQSDVLAKGTVDGTDIEVNGVYTYKDKLLVDATFIDKKDGYSTRLHDAFYLNSKPEMPNTSSRSMARSLTSDDIKQSSGLGSFTHNTYKSMYSWYPLVKSNDKILGYKNKDVVLDGTKKRALLWFDNQFSEKYKKPWYLVSPIFKDLKFKIEYEPKPLPKSLSYVLAKNYPYAKKIDSIEKKVLAKVEAFKKQKAKEEKVEHKKQRLIAKLESKESKPKSKFITIPPFSADSYGEEKVEKFKTVDELVQGLKTLQWIPSAYDVTEAIYSTSSIFTQGWGSENEMFKAVYDKVKDKDVKFGSYTLSDAGTLKLLKLAKAIPVQKKVPFVEWEEDGVKHSLVFPFLQPSKAVQQYLGDKTYLSKVVQKQARIKMTLTYMPKNDGTTTKSFGMFGGALSGATTSEKKDVILDKSWNIDEISGTPVDIYFPKTTAFYTDANGTHQDTVHALDDKKVEPKVLTVEITMPDGKLDTYEHHFQKKQGLKDVFFTFALGLPDIPRDILEKMEEKRVGMFKDIKDTKINPFSRLQWANRSTIYKFIALQTKDEKYLAKSLKLQVKHNKTLRTIMTVIEHIPEKKLIRHLDLRNVFADAYGRAKHVKSYNIMSGIFNAKAEASAIGGKGIFEIWDSNKEKNLALIDPSNKNEIIHMMQKRKINPRIVAHLKKSDKLWLYSMGIKKHIGWLEIDPKNYRIVSVHENGMYAAMAEKSEMDMALDSVSNYFIGLLAGVGTSEWIVVMHMHIENYCDLLKASEAMANKIACGVAIGGGIASPSVAGSISTTLGCYGHSKSSKAVSIFGGLAGNEAKTKIGKVSNGIAGFANGFGDGVSLYFMGAKIHGNCK